jgi:hypothetical protein
VKEVVLSVIISDMGQLKQIIRDAVESATLDVLILVWQELEY